MDGSCFWCKEFLLPLFPMWQRESAGLFAPHVPLQQMDRCNGWTTVMDGLLGLFAWCASLYEWVKCVPHGMEVVYRHCSRVQLNASFPTHSCKCVCARTQSWIVHVCVCACAGPSFQQFRPQISQALPSGAHLPLLHDGVSDGLELLVKAREVSAFAAQCPKGEGKNSMFQAWLSR